MALYRIYLIELEGGKWYVHKHPDPCNIGAIYSIACFYTPWKVGTPAWVEKYRPLSTNPYPTEHRCGALDDESLDRFVWELMQEKGIDNVRGGSFQSIELTRQDVMNLMRKPVRRPYEERTESEFESELLTRLRRIEERLNYM